MANITELLVQFNEKLEKLNQAVVDNEADSVNRIEAELKDIEDEYKDTMQREVFGQCSKAENPMLELVKVYTFDTISHKPIKESGVVVGYERSDKTILLDAVKFCKKYKLPRTWAMKCEKLAYYMCEDIAAKHDVPADEIEQMRKRYKFTLPESSGQDLGRNPISKNQFRKTLQGIVNDLLYLEEIAHDGEKSNRIRIIDADVEFVKKCFTKGVDEIHLSVKTITPIGVARAVFAVVHRIIAKKTYSVQYKVAREKVSNSTDAGKAEVSAPNQSKPETVTVPAPTAPEVSASDPVETVLPSLDEMKGDEVQ